MSFGFAFVFCLSHSKRARNANEMLHKSRRTLQFTHTHTLTVLYTPAHLVSHVLAIHWRQSKETCSIFEFRSTVFHSILLAFLFSSFSGFRFALALSISLSSCFSLWFLCAKTCFMYVCKLCCLSVYVFTLVCASQARHFSNFHFGIGCPR